MPEINVQVNGPVTVQIIPDSVPEMLSSVAETAWGLPKKVAVKWQSMLKTALDRR